MRKPLETNRINDGIQHLYQFSNGYGASVVRHRFSYTNSHTWELAVLRFKDKGYELTYETPITNDVIGHLSDDDVDRVLKEIEELPAANTKPQTHLGFPGWKPKPNQRKDSK